MRLVVSQPAQAWVEGEALPLGLVRAQLVKSDTVVHLALFQEHIGAVHLQVVVETAQPYLQGLGVEVATGQTGVHVLRWDDAPRLAEERPAFAPGEVVIEAFGCDPPDAFIARMHRSPPPSWINLEYLSAEDYVERSHGLASPMWSGAGKGLTKQFFYPGFTPATGGLLREPDLLARQAAFDRGAWRQAHSSAHGLAPEARWISLFCYEPAGLPALLAQCQQAQSPTHLLVTPGRAHAAVQAVLPEVTLPCTLQQLTITPLSPVPQPAFDELLWACDLNFVRGEDSLVRALWAGQPFIWHIYPQHDDAHHAKLEAFLDWLQAPNTLRQFHAVWNGLSDGPLPVLSSATLQEWAACVQTRP